MKRRHKELSEVGETPGEIRDLEANGGDAREGGITDGKKSIKEELESFHLVYQLGGRLAR